MTPFETRIRFRSANGTYPLWETRMLNYRNGKKRSTYGLWMEENIGNPRELRLQFEIESGEESTYQTDQNIEFLNGRYMDWLEDKIFDENISF